MSDDHKLGASYTIFQALSLLELASLMKSLQKKIRRWRQLQRREERAIIPSAVL